MPKKVAILSGSTVGEIKNILELFLLNAGIRPEFYVGGYALFYEELTFDADGALAAFAPDIIYVHTSARNLGNLPLQTDTPEQAEENSPRNAPAGRACGRRRPASAARSSRTILSCPACA